MLCTSCCCSRTERPRRFAVVLHDFFFFGACADIGPCGGFAHGVSVHAGAESQFLAADGGVGLWLAGVVACVVRAIGAGGADAAVAAPFAGQ